MNKYLTQSNILWYPCSPSKSLKGIVGVMVIVFRVNIISNDVIQIPIFIANKSENFSNFGTLLGYTGNEGELLTRLMEALKHIILKKFNSPLIGATGAVNKVVQKLYKKNLLVNETFILSRENHMGNWEIKEVNSK